MLFHKCKALLEDEDLEKKIDLGVPVEEQYTRVRFRYADVTDYVEWVEEDEFSQEIIKGTIIYTIMGKVYFIQTSLDDFDSSIEAYMKSPMKAWGLDKSN